MTDISVIPTDELLRDLRESETDICTCLVALGLGVESYTGNDGTTCNVRDRYKANKRIVAKIENELMRRGITLAQVQP